MTKRIISIAIMILMLASLAVPAMAASSPNEARDSLVCIDVIFQDEDNNANHKYCIPKDEVKTHEYAITHNKFPLSELADITRTAGSGSGFFVGNDGENPQYLITNHHVVDLYMDCGQGDRFTIFDPSRLSYYTGRAKIYGLFSDDSYKELYVVDSDEKKDLAVLKLAEPTSKRKPLTLTVPDDNMVGEKIYALGYPGLSITNFAKPTELTGISSVSIKDGVIGKLFVNTGSGRNDIEMTCDIQHGHSGGPLVTEDGNVIGVNEKIVTTSYSELTDNGYVVKEMEKNTYGINISEAIDILKKNDISYALSENKPSKKNTTEPVPAPQPTNDNTLMFVIIAIAAVIVIAAVVIIIIIVTKKNKKSYSAPAPQVPQSPQAPQPVLKSGFIRSLAMQHRGLRIKLQPNNQVIIGRSKSDCAIVFKEGTPGVSGRHCSVSFNPATSEFTVTDLGSSYGTFLENGTKLTSGISHKMRAGDRFYLGENSNMLVLEVE